MYNDMPRLVDPDSQGIPFIPPLPGATQGGQPTGYPPFPNPTYNSNPWPSPPQPPPTWLHQHQHHQQQQQQYIPPPPQTWPFGQYTPFGAPTPAGSWGIATPAGSYGPPTPASAPMYSPWPPAIQQYPTFYGPEPAIGQASPWVNAVPLKKKSSKGRKGTPHPHAVGGHVLQRATSLGGGGGGGGGGGVGTGAGLYRTRSSQYAPYQQQEEYNARNLARRPKDWRPDYDPREGLASYIPRIIKPHSDVQEWSDPLKRTPHEYLGYKPSDPPISYDLRTNPLDPQNPHLELLRLHRRLNPLDYVQLATTPATQSIRLFHPSLPWYIDVFQAHQSGVTVRDVLWQMYVQLDMPILGRHWFNECLTDSDRARMAECFQERVEGRVEEAGRGVKRVEFLRGRVVFEGLVRTKSGIWEIKTRKVEGFV